MSWTQWQGETLPTTTNEARLELTVNAADMGGPRQNWRFGLTQNEICDWGTIENRLYLHDIDHLMDNYTLRPVAETTATLQRIAAGDLLIIATFVLTLLLLGILPEIMRTAMKSLLLWQELVYGVILVLAANTSFADFPRLASFHADDAFMPKQLTKRGHRLVFSNGILFLAGAMGTVLTVWYAVRCILGLVACARGDAYPRPFAVLA